MRNEIKYKFPRKELFCVKEKLIENSFNYVYNNRIVNNIYFDTLKDTSFYENIEGLKKRIKYRVRWYGNSRLEQQSNVVFQIPNEKNDYHNERTGI